MDWWIYVLIFWAGILIGWIIRGWMMMRFSPYTGVILVSKEEGKTLYSLILEDYPEKIELQKHVLFKVLEESEEDDRK